MCDPLGHQLTPAQIRALASLVPRRKPQLPNATDIIHPLLDFFRRDIRNFLFTPEAIHIPHLLSPAAISNSLTCISRSTSIDPAPSPPHNAALPGESQDLHGHMIFVPAVTLDHMTIGVGVLNAAATSIWWMADDGVTQTVQMNFRFARNAKTQTLLIVQDAPNDCFLVFTAQVESPTRTRKSACLFRKSDLRNMLLQENGMVSAGDLLPLLIEAQHQVHYRNCCICGAPATAWCSCQFPMSEPAHPFDASYFQKGMDQHANTSQTVGSKVFYANGVPKRHLVLGAQMSLAGIADASITRSLIEWSVSKYMQSMSQDPLQSFITVERDHRSIENQDMYGQSKNLIRGRILHTDQQMSEANIPQAGPSLMSKQSDDVFLPTIAEVRSVEEFAANTGTTTMDCKAVSAAGTDRSSIAGEEWWQQNADGRERGAQVQSEGWTSLNPDVSSPSIGGAVVANGTLAKKQQSAEMVDEAVRLEKIRKAKERREKNRRAAHISNMRNKRMRDQLKADVQEAHNRVEVLRARELALRKENLSLRAALGG